MRLIISSTCLSQLLIHYEEILRSIQEGENADFIYLDFTKAFDDKVDHNATSDTPYPGLTITDARKNNNMIQKAQRLANMTYSIIARTCHKLTIGKAY